MNGGQRSNHSTVSWTYVRAKAFEHFVEFQRLIPYCKYKQLHAVNWISTVENAKPAIPKAGIKDKPKIKIGFNIIFKITPTIKTFL